MVGHLELNSLVLYIVSCNFAITTYNVHQDTTNPFDTVAHNKLWKALIESGMPLHLVWVVEQLYSRVIGVIHIQTVSSLKKMADKDAISC